MADRIQWRAKSGDQFEHPLRADIDAQNPEHGVSDERGVGLFEHGTSCLNCSGQPLAGSLPPFLTLPELRVRYSDDLLDVLDDTF